MLDAGTLLDFAARHPRVRGDVEERIRRELGVTPARYCQLLHRAAATIKGQAHDPITAHRVLRELSRESASAHILPTLSHSGRS